MGAGRKHRTSLRSSSLDRRPSESASEEENSEEDDEEEEEAKSSELRKMEELLKGTLPGWPGQGGSVRGSAKSARGGEGRGDLVTDVVVLVGCPLGDLAGNLKGGGEESGDEIAASTEAARENISHLIRGEEEERLVVVTSQEVWRARMGMHFAPSDKVGGVGVGGGPSPMDDGGRFLLFQDSTGQLAVSKNSLTDRTPL